MRSFLVLLAWMVTPATAVEPSLRPSAHLLFKHPEILKAGACVYYREGSGGMTEPTFYLKATVLSAEVQTRHLGRCPLVPGKNWEQYSRDDFNRHALAYPCVAANVPERDEQTGVVRLRVDSWETPHSRRAANAGRLYRGMFIDKTLVKNMEIELEADLLGPCEE